MPDAANPLMKDETGPLMDASATSQQKESRDWLSGRVLGKYRLIKQIGSGAFASIYEAAHIHLHVPFAIKILHPAFLNHEEVVTRFFREAKAASQLQHENVVFIADFDVEEDVGPYIVMEYLEGKTLQTLLEEEGALSLELVGELSRQICQVLGLAHRKGIVHRDLKPENIFLVAREMGRILTKILDFGIAHLSRSSESITGARLMGTPVYMAPEQFRGSSTSSTSLDIYSFGVILYEMLTGAPPFQGQNVQQLGIEHLLIPAPALEEHFPSALRQLQARLLAKSAEERPSSMEEVWQLLAPALDPQGRFPHWHRQEPIFSSASLPAISAKPPREQTEDTAVHPIPTKKQDTWSSTDTETTAQESDISSLRALKAKQNNEMFDTILSDEEFDIHSALPQSTVQVSDTIHPVDAEQPHTDTLVPGHTGDLQPIEDDDDEFPISQQDLLEEDDLLDEEEGLGASGFLSEEGQLQSVILDEEEPPLDRAEPPAPTSDSNDDLELVVRPLEGDLWETTPVSGDQDKTAVSESPISESKPRLPPPAKLPVSETHDTHIQPAPRRPSAKTPPPPSMPTIPTSAPATPLPHSASLTKKSPRKQSMLATAEIEGRQKPQGAIDRLFFFLGRFGFMKKLNAMNRAEKRLLLIVWVGVVLAMFSVLALLVPEMRSRAKKTRKRQNPIIRRVVRPGPGKRPILRYNPPSLRKKVSVTYRRIVLTTEPSKVRVYEDGRFLGFTPLAIHRPLGWVLKASLKHKDFQTRKIRHRVDHDPTQQLFFRLKPR